MLAEDIDRYQMKLDIDKEHADTQQQACYAGYPHSPRQVNRCRRLAICAAVTDE